MGVAVVFIGPNGAGKTTTMRIIATLLNPTWGEAYVCGNSIYTKPKEIRRLVGYMPDFFGVYDDMTVIEYLEFFAASYRIQGPTRRKRCDEMLDIVDLDFKRDAYANTLSWRNPTTPLPMENQPRAVFERLFGDSDNTTRAARLARIQDDRSVLDSLVEEVRRMRRRLCASSRNPPATSAGWRDDRRMRATPVVSSSR